jgi:hypothetical protein
MIGIPIFLIILKDVGKLLSRGLRKIYKRMHSAKKRLPDGRRMSAPVKVGLFQLKQVAHELKEREKTTKR